MLQRDANVGIEPLEFNKLLVVFVAKTLEKERAEKGFKRFGQTTRRTGQSLREYINASAQKIENVRGLTRHKYIWPLDDEMKELAVKLSIPYPQK